MGTETWKRILAPGLALAIAAATTGCHVDWLTDRADAGSATLDLAITDAPIDRAAAVELRITGVHLVPASGEPEQFDFDTPLTVEMLRLQGSNSEPLLSGETVPAGEYTAIRLLIDAEPATDDSLIEFLDGTIFSLALPESADGVAEHGERFTLEAGEKHAFTLDFDLRRSLRPPADDGNDYRLEPVTRLVDDDTAGHAEGTVDAALVSDSECFPAVYAYSGRDVEPGELGSATEPVNTALVEPAAGQLDSVFFLGFLPEGDYTMALTCRADRDEVDTTDGVTFSHTLNVTIEAGETSQPAFRG